MSAYHIVTLNYMAEKTIMNRDSYNPNRKKKVVLFDCSMKESDSLFTFIKQDGREKSYNKPFVISVETGRVPDNVTTFNLDVDEAF